MHPIFVRNFVRATGRLPLLYLNIKNIRVLLTEAFSDEELRQLCYDETPFKPVYEQLTQAMSKDTLIHHLIEYAERRDLMESLLAAVKERNPAKYNQYHPY